MHIVVAYIYVGHGYAVVTVNIASWLFYGDSTYTSLCSFDS